MNGHCALAPSFGGLHEGVIVNRVHEMNGHCALATSFGGLVHTYAQESDHVDDIQESHVYALYVVNCYVGLAGGADYVCRYHPWIYR